MSTKDDLSKSETQMGLWSEFDRPAEAPLTLDLYGASESENREANRGLLELVDELHRARILEADLFDFGPVPYVSLDEQGRIERSNLAAQRLLGRSRAALSRHYFASAAGVIEREGLTTMLTRVFRDHSHETGEFTLFPSASQALRALVIAAPYQDVTSGSRRCFLALVDVTARRESEDAFEFLSQASDELGASFDVQVTLERAANLAARFVGEACAIELELGSGESMFAAEVATGPAFDALRKLARRDRRLGFFGSIVEDVHRSGVSERETTLDSRTTRLSEEREALQNLHVEEVLCFPLRLRSGSRGTLSVLCTNRRRITSTARVGEELSRRLMSALEQCDLYAQAQSAIRQRDEFLGVVAHDLRGGMMALRLSSDLLLREGRHEERRKVGRRQLEAINRASRWMGAVLEDLLQSSSLESGKMPMNPVRLSCQSLVTEAVDIFSAAASSHAIVLQGDVPQGVPAIHGDRDRLLQVLVNLVTNALKFTPEGGQVTIRCAPVNGCVQISVEDTGPGVPTEQLSKMFVRYWQAKPSSGTGSGLGLSIAERLVRRHGGEIWAESELGHGTQVFFTVPTDKTEAAKASV